MDKFIKFITDYYIVFIVLSIFFAISLVGFIVDSKKEKKIKDNKVSNDQIIDETEKFNEIPLEQVINSNSVLEALSDSESAETINDDTNNDVLN